MDSKQETVLCMFSGGLDSLGVLYLLLTHEQYQKYKIHIHHMHLVNIENRAHAEATAVNACLEYFKKNNHAFSFSTSYHDYNCLNKKFILDTHIMTFVAGTLCSNDHMITKIAVGRTKTDVSNATVQFWHQINVARIIFKTMLENKSDNKSPSFIFPVMNLTKAEVYELLPDGLNNSFWSCRRPIYTPGAILTCKTCKPCRDLKIIKN